MSNRPVAEAREVAGLGMPAVILFGIPAHKDAAGSDNYSPGGIAPQAIRAIKDAAPGLVVISDMCFCEYTDHGHCGIVSYAAKYASGFYGPFRDAVVSALQFGDRSQYQMDPANGWLDLRRCALETLVSIKRAGADLILTYFARDAARSLNG